MADVKTLLPSSSGQGLRDLEQVTARIGEIDIEIYKLWNPAECPESLLGWLAWTLSVDNWDIDWTEKAKRDVIRQSLFVHRHKGTVGAVKRALAALSFKAEIREWYETGDEPGTFRIEVERGEILSLGLSSGALLLKVISDAINASNRKSAHYTLTILEKYTSKFYVSSALRVVSEWTATHDVQIRTE